MGIDVKAITLIGIKIHQSKLLKSKIVLEYSNECCKEHDSKYCPKCGSLIQTKIYKLPPYEGIEDHNLDFPDKIYGFEYICGIEPEDDEWFLYGWSNHTDYTRSREDKLAVFTKDIPDIGAIEQEMKRALTPYGLWDEDTFGLYTLCSVNY